MNSSSFHRLALCAALTACSLSAQVTYERILNSASEPGNWLTYNGTYASRHHSSLKQINRENRGRPRAEVGLPSQIAREVRVDAAGG